MYSRCYMWLHVVNWVWTTLSLSQNRFKRSCIRLMLFTLLLMLLWQFKMTRDVLSSDVMLKHQHKCALSFSWTCDMGKTQLLGTKKMFFKNVGLYTTRLCVQKISRSACMSCARGNVVSWGSVYSGGADIVSVI